MHYSYSGHWAEALPSGIAFCHWGGRNASRKVLTALERKKHEPILDVCCGAGGLLSLIETSAFGIDIDCDLISKARLTSPQHAFIVGDAFSMPYATHSFTKVCAQDPDMLLEGEHDAAFSEIARVSARGAKFVLQTYGETTRISKHERKHISAALEGVGYSTTRPICLDRVAVHLNKAGFNILKSIDLHLMYAQDNARMIQRARNLPDSYRHLFDCERALFATRAWSGALFIAKRR